MIDEDGFISEWALYYFDARFRPVSTAQWRAMRDAVLPRRGLTETCGRCGTVDYVGSIAYNHDLGYTGCPTELDPTWSKIPMGPGFRNAADGRESSHLSEDEMCDRWDAKMFPPCADCEHPFGLHSHGMCYIYCGCRQYHVEGVRLVSLDALDGGRRTLRVPTAGRLSR